MNIPFTKRARKLLGLAADRAKALSPRQKLLVNDGAVSRLVKPPWQPVDVEHIVWAVKKLNQLEREQLDFERLECQHKGRAA